MTATELLAAFESVIRDADLVSALALADELHDVGFDAAAGRLRQGYVGGTRVIMPQACEYRAASGSATVFLCCARPDRRVVIRGVPMCFCNRHARMHHEFRLGHDICPNCRWMFYD